MRQKSERRATPEQIVKNIRRATRKHHSAEEKIRIVLECPSSDNLRQIGSI